MPTWLKGLLVIGQHPNEQAQDNIAKLEYGGLLILPALFVLILSNLFPMT
jgi:hypothetical protein